MYGEGEDRDGFGPGSQRGVGEFEGHLRWDLWTSVSSSDKFSGLRMGVRGENGGGGARLGSG